MIPAQAVIDEARKWIGVPFHHQGRVRAGVDCVGLIVVVMDGLGLMPRGADLADYGRHPNGTLTRVLDEHCTRLDAPLPGSVAVIRWWRQAHHVAIHAGETLIHSHQRFGGVAEHSFAGRWKGRCMAWYALPGVSYGR